MERLKAARDRSLTARTFLGGLAIALRHVFRRGCESLARLGSESWCMNRCDNSLPYDSTATPSNDLQLLIHSIGTRSCSDPVAAFESEPAPKRLAAVVL